MNRSDFQQLAVMRLEESRVLLDAQLYAGAYYLAGYIVECALKACIAKNIKQYEFPDKTLIREINKLYGHNFTELLGLAGLRLIFEGARQSNAKLDVNWATVLLWASEKRYQANISEVDARNLFAAITEADGILPWLKTHW